MVRLKQYCAAGSVDKNYLAGQATRAHGPCAASSFTNKSKVAGLQEEYPDLSGKPGAVAQPQPVAPPAVPDRPGWDMDERSVLPPPGEAGNVNSLAYYHCLCNWLAAPLAGKHDVIPSAHRSGLLKGGRKHREALTITTS